MLAWFALLPLSLIAAGLVYRHQRIVHARFMVTAFIADAALFTYVIVWREPMVRLMETEVGGVLRLHVGFSLATLALYVVLIGSGVVQWRRPRAMRFHVVASVVFVVCRVGGFVTSLGI